MGMFSCLNESKIKNRQKALAAYYDFMYMAMVLLCVVDRLKCIYSADGGDQTAEN